VKEIGCIARDQFREVREGIADHPVTNGYAIVDVSDAEASTPREIAGHFVRGRKRRYISMICPGRSV
jgi:hypothetical protein